MPPRSVADKLQEIALRSPQDLAALEAMADLVIGRLNEQGINFSLSYRRPSYR